MTANDCPTGMMSFFHHILIVTSLLVASAAFALDDQLTPFAPAQVKLNELGLLIIKEKCARPRSVSNQAVENRYDPKVTDEIQTIICNGFEIVTYFAKSLNPPRELPQKLIISKGHPKIPKHLSIGASVAAIRTKLGRPWYEEGENFSYGLDGESESTVTFKVAHGNVQAIVWAWYSE